MIGFRQYLLRVISISLLCSILPLIAGSGNKKMLRLICSICLTIVIIGPVLDLDSELSVNDLFPDGAAHSIAEQGKLHSIDAMAAIIKENTEAYILDKAELLGAQLHITVEVYGEEVPVPVSAILRGDITWDQRTQLEEILAGELGIPKEAQQWISS